MAAGLCYGVRGGGAQLCFHITAGNYDTDILIQVLSELRRFLGGEKATLLWEGLPAHNSRARQAWLNPQRHWLVGNACRLRRRSSTRPRAVVVAEGGQAGTLACPTLREVMEHAEPGIQQARSTPQLASSFLRRTGLSVS